MHEDSSLGDAAQFLKVMGNAPRLRLLLLLSREPSSVAGLVQKSGMSHPLVSQHLRTLRLAGVARAVRSGREVTYYVADDYVTRILMDALAHADEPRDDKLPADQLRASAELATSGAPRRTASAGDPDADPEARLHTRRLHRLDAIVKTFMAYEHIGSDTHLEPSVACR